MELNSSRIKFPQNKARAFTPHWCAASAKMKKLIEEVQTQIDGYEHYYKTRKRARRAVDQRSFERMIEAILCHLPGVHGPSVQGCAPLTEQQGPEKS